MNLMANIIASAVLLFFSIWSFEPYAQARVIPIQNPSFEGNPTQGGVEGNFQLRGWWDCGFKMETPPDIQAGSKTAFFDVLQEPFDGETYLGMVVRANNTYERISQKLLIPMISGQCYRFSIYLSRSSQYKAQLSGYIDNPEKFKHIANQADSKLRFDFVNPCVLRIWGGSGYCVQKELLAESVEVINKEWMLYEFHFKPRFDHTYFELEVYYKTPIITAYNGNILLDKATNIIPVPCPEEDKLFTSVVKDPEYEIAKEQKVQQVLKKAKPPKTNQSTLVRDKIAKLDTNPVPKETPEPKILKELSKEKVHKGQIIKIDQLFFAADSTQFDKSSEKVLDEIYEFLSKNPNIKVEIGGHTNNRPKLEYCQRLSELRAKNVYDYLIDKGINSNRITYKGYGKRRPIASNKSVMGRRKNQRVEIKILSTNHSQK